MRLSENRVIAWIVLVLAVLFSVSFSGGGAMKNMRFGTEQIFTDGAQKDGLSINRDLDVRADKAYVMVSIAKKYLAADNASLVAADQACQELTDSSKLPADQRLAGRHTANTKLTRAIEDLYSTLEQTSMTEADKSNVYSAYKEIKSRADTISRDMYNSEARTFNESISKFPANLVAGFTGVKPLQLFE